ncbi:hypothetical protein [Sinomonas sp. P10A9]|uniref:Uncharacterized protein n=1 Tax=Sinomonas puerhi TaxID=3238584 RepID=A0AB39KZ21_9MICC
MNDEELRSREIALGRVRDAQALVTEMLASGDLGPGFRAMVAEQGDPMDWALSVTTVMAGTVAGMLIDLLGSRELAMDTWRRQLLKSGIDSDAELARRWRGEGD